MIFEKNGFWHVGKRISTEIINKAKENGVCLAQIARYKTKYRVESNRSKDIGLRYLKKNFDHVWLELHQAAMLKIGTKQDKPIVESIQQNKATESLFNLQIPELASYGYKILELTASNRSEWTNKDYTGKFKRAIEFFGHNRKIDTIKVSDILEYKNHLALKYNASSTKSWTNHLIPLSLIFDMAYSDYCILTNNPLQHSLVKRLSQQGNNNDSSADKAILTDTQLKNLFEQFDKEVKKVANAKDKIAHAQAARICKLRAILGLRSSESIALKWSDFEGDYLIVQRQIRQKHGEVKIIRPKKGKIRHVAIPAQAKDLLKEQFEITGKFGDWVFLNKYGNHYTSSQTIEEIFHRALENAGLPYVKYYSLRASAATRLMNKGVSDLVIKKQLGHVKISTTEKHYIGKLNLDKEIIEKMCM